MSLVEYTANAVDRVDLVPGSLEYWKRRAIALESSKSFWQGMYDASVNETSNLRSQLQKADADLEKAKSQEANQTRASQTKATELNRLTSLNRKIGNELIMAKCAQKLI